MAFQAVLLTINLYVQGFLDRERAQTLIMFPQTNERHSGQENCRKFKSAIKSCLHDTFANYQKHDLQAYFKQSLKYNK